MVLQDAVPKRSGDGTASETRACFLTTEGHWLHHSLVMHRCWDGGVRPFHKNPIPSFWLHIVTQVIIFFIGFSTTS